MSRPWVREVLDESVKGVRDLVLRVGDSDPSRPRSSDICPPVTGRADTGLGCLRLGRPPVPEDPWADGTPSDKQGINGAL